MRDLAVLCILASLAGAAFIRPWLGVLALAVMSYLVPHGYTEGWMSGAPAYLLVFAAACLGYGLHLVRGGWRPPPWDWRLVALGLLWGYFLYTTLHAKAPWVAWPKFYEVSKVLLPLGLSLLLIDTREKFNALVAVMAVAIGLVAVKGGYWALTTGFSDRVYGPPASAYHDNNHFAVAAILNIPLLVLLLRQATGRALRGVLMVAVALSVAAALSSWSRGALITLIVTLVVLLVHSRRKLLAAAAVGLTAALALVLLPEGWFARMDTILEYQGEGSAENRLAAWRAGIAYALENPLAGSGFEGWRFVTLNERSRMDWHNGYVEIMAEHGLVAFGLWLSLLVGSLTSLTRLARAAARTPELAWARDPALMLRAALVAYATGTVFLGLAYWDLYYHLVVLAVILSARLATGPQRLPGVSFFYTPPPAASQPTAPPTPIH